MSSNVIEFSIKALDDFSATMGKFGTSLSKTEQAFAALGVTAAAYAAVRLAKASLDNADAMGVAAEKANMTVEAFSELAWAAKLSNVEQGSLTVGLKMLNRAIADGDMSPAGRQLAALGIASKDANGNLRKTEDVMMDVADAFKNGAQDGNKTKIAMELLGRSGTEMVPFLNQGSAAIRGTGEEAKKLGVIIGNDFSQSANQINDNLDKMSQMMTGVFNDVMKRMSPAIEGLTTKYIDLAVESGGIQKTGKQIATAFRLIASAAIVVAAVIQALGDAIGAVAAAAVAVAKGDFSAAAKIISSAYSKSVDIVSDKMAELDVVWDENVKSAAAVASATEKMAASHKKSMKTVGDADAAAKREADAYADVQKRLTALLNSAETPYEAHARRLEEIAQLQKDLGGTSEKLTAALKKENAAWDKAKIATDEYKNSATSAMDTLRDLYAAQMEALGSIAYQTAQIMLTAWNDLSKGIGDAVGRSLVYGDSLSDGIKSAVMNMMVNVISSFIEMGIAGVTSGLAVQAAWWEVSVIMAAIVAVVFILKEMLEMGFFTSFFEQVAELVEDIVTFVDEFVDALVSLKGIVELLKDTIGDTGNSVWGALGDFLKEIGNAFNSILQYVREIMSALGGGLFGDIFGDLGDFLGFAGGGYTGSGARAGGLDGQGGFMAMLHPQETVIDHARGQGGGGMAIQSVTIHVLENATNIDAFRGMNKIELRNALGQPVVDALNEMFAIGVRPTFAMVNR